MHVYVFPPDGGAPRPPRWGFRPGFVAYGLLLVAVAYLYANLGEAPALRQYLIAQNDAWYYEDQMRKAMADLNRLLGDTEIAARMLELEQEEQAERARYHEFLTDAAREPEAE